MMRSLFCGVSGLRNHLTRMDVIGNNIANVNTFGFKGSRVTFQDMLSQTIAGAAAPEEKKGGVNPRQIGLGMMIGSIDTIHTQGSLQSTGRNTDIAIRGDGFFILAEGERLHYTRAGAFALDKEGALVNPANGLRVQGWRATPEGDINIAAKIEDIIIPIMGKEPAKATGYVGYMSNLDSTSPMEVAAWTPAMRASAAVTSNIDVYDSEGERHRLSLMFWRTGINTWTASAAVTGIDPGSAVTLDVAGPAGANPNSRVNIAFNNDGAIISLTDNATADTIAAGRMAVTSSFTIRGVIQNVTFDLGTAGLYEGITQFSSPSTTKAYTQDGYPMGYLESFTIDDRGIATGVYTNGKRAALAQIAIGSFVNPGGLEKAGESLFDVTGNSGEADVGPAGEAGRGEIAAGFLEMSNVEMAQEFVEMIITQRGFQANSRIITTSDQMLQELLALKR